MKDRAGRVSADEVEGTPNILDAGSAPLFEAAFRAHYASLIQYLQRRVRNDADARDIAQESYLRLLRYQTNQDLGSLKALLFRIATNLLAMRARTAHAQHWADSISLDEELAIPANDPSQEQHLADEQQLDRLMATIQRLPPKCQQVFVLSRFHDMTYSQIAERCGISVKMVEKHITKALETCRIEVGDDLP